MKRLAGFLMLALCAWGQPRLQNARLENRSGANLDAELKSFIAAQTEPGWIGYAVPIVKGERNMCCYWSDGNNSWRGCGLESGQRPGVSGQTTPAAPIRLEGPEELIVLFRAENKQVTKLRTFSPECDLDAGGVRVVWLTGVRPEDSLQALAAYATTADTTREAEKFRDSAVSAIALHASPAADAYLEKFAGASQPEGLRKKVMFWLGNARGRKGYELLSRYVKSDPSEKVREQAIFGLTQSREPEAIKTVIAVAKEDTNPRVRGQALFWLGQKAGDQATATIRDAVNSDPEVEVKKKAVFALSQLPKDEGVPLLIQVARTHKDPAVKKQAMFWLGQSKDPRAIAFFEEVLTR